MHSNTEMNVTVTKDVFYDLLLFDDLKIIANSF